MRYHWRALWLLNGLVIVHAGCDYQDLCPQATPDWETRELTVEEMKAAVAPYTRARAERIARHGEYCEEVPIGRDARNGRPVFITMECDDVCPNYSQFLVTYGHGVPAGEPCQDEGFCSLMGGAGLFPILCMPFSQGYDRCGSEPNCNWNGICEPENLEDPFRCPIECPCGAAGSGPPTDWIATALALPRTPEDDLELSYELASGRTNSVSRYLAAWEAVVGDLDSELAGLQESLRNGSLPWLLRWETDDPHYDTYVALRVQVGPPQLQPLRRDGTDLVTIAHPFREGAVLCGRGGTTAEGSISAFARAKQGALPLPLPGLSRAPLTLMKPELLVTRDASGLMDVGIRGVLTLEALEDELLPALAADLNARIAAGSPQADRIASSLDGGCDPSLCPNETPGQGECATSTPAVITPTEILCHPAFFEAFLPDYDLVRNGENDALWVGLRLAGFVPVHLVEP